MNRMLFLLLVPTLGWAAPLPSLAPPAELTLDGPWSTPVTLALPGDGPYRLEATGLGGDPVEVVLERRVPGGTWKPVATNKTLRGNVEAVVDWTAATGEDWRVRPTRPENKTVVLRLKRSAFASLKEALKQDLTAGPEVSSPLHLRTTLPLGTGGPGLVAATGPQGELWLGWLVAQGAAAEVWEAGTGRRLGRPLAAGPEGPWVSMELGPSGPDFVGRRPGVAQARTWTGLDWAVEAAPAPQALTTAQGTFRYETAPVARVFRATGAGWADLQLPVNRTLDRLLLGSTEDGLYAFLASSTGRERAFYLWRPGDGWTALAAPAAEGPPTEGLWAATNGAGSLFHLEGRGPSLILGQFDGTEWRPPLDLSALVPGGAQAVLLLPPSAYSKTGTLVVATDRVSVYDLP